jgi:heme-degrading monooxygenase HmoA
MIARHWTGVAFEHSASAYVEHLRRQTFPELQTIPGFVSASILCRRVDAGVEFLVVTRWASLQAIEQFAGNDAERAVVPDEVQAMMVAYDRTVRHYDVVEG